MKGSYKKAGFLIILLCIAAMAFIFTPKKYFGKNDDISLYRVIWNGSGERVNVTETSDLEGIEQLLKNMKCKRYAAPFTPLSGADIVCEIDGDMGSAPLHIVFSSSGGYVYESAEKGGYKIYDSEKLAEEIKNMTDVFSSAPQP